MINTYHVLTPFSRFENLRALIDMLSAQRSPRYELRWHLLMDDNLPFAFRFAASWITVHYCPPVTPFWCYWANALNLFISRGNVEDDHRYLIENDDDLYEKGFFEKLDQIEGEVIAVSMLRGDQTPSGVPAERAHGCNELVACPENMIPGRVGAEQLVVSGKIFRAHGFENRIDADGWRTMAIVKENPSRVVYAPHIHVLFNGLEPGRWTTLPD